MSQELKPFCKKCGDNLPHDEDFCKNNAFPALAVEHREAVKVAHVWNIDLTLANEKQAGGGRFGAIEGDIMLEIASLINNFERKESHMMSPEAMKKLGMEQYIKYCLECWGYDSKEDKATVENIIKNSTEDDRRNKHFWFKEVYTLPVLKYEVENHIKNTREAIQFYKQDKTIKILDFWYDCNAFKLQLGELYQRRMKEGTLNTEDQNLIQAFANTLTNLETRIDKL